jgi:signal transduction histidine kinase
MTMVISKAFSLPADCEATNSTAAYDHLLWGIAVLDGERRLRYYNQRFADFLGRQTGLQFTTDDLLGQELPLSPLWDSEPEANAGRWQLELSGDDGVMVADKQGGGLLANVHSEAVYLLQLLPGVAQKNTVSSSLADAITHGQDGNKEKIELLTSFSHEFRTPLNAVLGFGNLLLGDVSKPAQREWVEGIIGAGSHLLKLVNEILTLSKAEYDCSEIALCTENVDVKAIIAECVALLQPMAQEAGVLLVQKGVACHLICDQTRLRQIILNLLSNAIKYKRGTGQVVINSLAIGNRCAGIEVQDNGLGIPEILSETIFSPFKRLLIGAANTEGSGLGLMLTRRLVNMMGGRIRVSSRESRGSVFAVDFNLDDDMAGTAGRQSRTVLCLGRDDAELQFIQQLLNVRPGMDVHCHRWLPEAELGSGELVPELVIVGPEALATGDLQADALLKQLLQRVPSMGKPTTDQQAGARQLIEHGVTTRLDVGFTPIDFYEQLDGLLSSWT